MLSSAQLSRAFKGTFATSMEYGACCGGTLTIFVRAVVTYDACMHALSQWHEFPTATPGPALGKDAAYTLCSLSS